MHFARWSALLLAAANTVVLAQTENVIHTFQGQPGNDGFFPEITPLVYLGGNLYGTTNWGGGGNCDVEYPGCGFIYELTPSASGEWTETAIWRFRGETDGGYPGGLILSGGHLWGIAGTGGSGACTGGCGYLFRLDPPASAGGRWTKTGVFDFPTSDEECGISAVDSAGVFYGASGSASQPNGNICKLSPPRSSGGEWQVTNLYNFRGVPKGEKFGDGSGPIGVVFDSSGNLWGVTSSGGYCQRFEGGSCFGALFELTPPSATSAKWTETVVYRFRNTDQNPTSPLTIDGQGAVYGVTYVETYKYSNGVFSVIGTFSDVPPNGYAPTGGVAVDSSGNVYGTTGAGGQFGYGTVYELAAPSYSQSVLYSFAAGTDGWNPEGPVILGPDGTIYGTTQIGGNQGCKLGTGGIGCGIVFEVIP